MFTQLHHEKEEATALYKLNKQIFKIIGIQQFELTMHKWQLN